MKNKALDMYCLKSEFKDQYTWL